MKKPIKLNYLNQVHKSCQEGFNLFEEYKNLIHINTGLYQVKNKIFSPNQLWNDLKEKTLKFDKNIDFEFEKIKNIPYKVLGDKEKISYVLQRLIDNAIERSKGTRIYFVNIQFSFHKSMVHFSNSECKISSQSADQYLIFQVTDKGHYLTK
jgi:signal transduction histidine kinase